MTWAGECTPDPWEREIALGIACRVLLYTPQGHIAAQCGKVSSAEGSTFPSSGSKGAHSRRQGQKNWARTLLYLQNQGNGATRVLPPEEDGSSTAEFPDSLSPGSASPSVAPGRSPRRSLRSEGPACVHSDPLRPGLRSP